MNERPPARTGSHFDTDHLSNDLKGRSVRGGAVTFIGQGAKFCLQLGSTVVLARLLTPEDFGLIAMVAAVTGFVLVFKDLGLSMATVQRCEINHEQVSTLFWINMALGLALMLATMALAPIIAWFYHDPRLNWITFGLSAAFIFGGLTVQHQALLRRQMRFVALATIDISSAALGAAAGIVSSLAGLGYWSLVLMQLVTVAAMAVGVWLASGWRPGWIERDSGVKPMLSFGGYLTGFSVVNYFARNIDGILIGRFSGAQSVGAYSKAYSLLLLPISQVTAPISAVAIPTLSRLQNEPARFRQFYLKAIKLIAYVTMPMVVAMGVLSSEIVALILGDQWTEAVSLFRVLAVVALIQPIGGTVGWVYVSLGQARRMFSWACIAVPIVVLSFVVGIWWGAMGVAYGYAISSCILIYPQLAFAFRRSPIRASDVFLTIYRPFFLSVFMGMAMVASGYFLAQFGVVARLIGSLFVGGVALMFAARIFGSVWSDFADMLSIAKLGLAKN